MVKVRIWGSLQKATDNKEFVEVEAENFKQLLQEKISLNIFIEITQKSTSPD